MKQNNGKAVIMPTLEQMNSTVDTSLNDLQFFLNCDDSREMAAQYEAGFFKRRPCYDDVASNSTINSQNATKRPNRNLPAVLETSSSSIESDDILNSTEVIESEDQSLKNVRDLSRRFEPKPSIAPTLHKPLRKWRNSVRPAIPRKLSIEELSKELPTTQRMREHNDGFYYDHEEFSFMQSKPLTTSTPRIPEAPPAPRDSLDQNIERISALNDRRPSTLRRRKSLPRKDYDTCQIVYVSEEPRRRRSSVRRSRSGRETEMPEPRSTSTRRVSSPVRRRSSASGTGLLDGRRSVDDLEDNDRFDPENENFGQRSSSRNSSIHRTGHIPDFSSNRNSTPQSLAGFLIDDLEQRFSKPSTEVPSGRRSTRSHRRSTVPRRRSTRSSQLRQSRKSRHSSRMPVPSSRCPEQVNSKGCESQNNYGELDRTIHAFVDTLSSFPSALKWQVNEIINICKRS